MRPAVMGGGENEERMGPDETGEDGDASDEVCTVTATEPGVEAPIVRPLMVTLNVVLAPMVAPAVVSTTAVVLVAPHVMLRPDKLLAPAATTGVMEGAKKLDGYVRVMRPPGGSSLSAVKVMVAATLALVAVRSEGAISKMTSCVHTPVAPMTKYGGPQASGASNVNPLCVKATSRDGRM